MTGQETTPIAPDEAAKRALTGAPAATWPSAGEGAAELSEGGSAEFRAGDLPVRVEGRTGDVRVRLLDRAEADKAGVSGPLLRVSGAEGPVTVAIDYSGFRHAFGGDWASRLTVVQLPDHTPVESHNDSTLGRLTASFSLPGESGRTFAGSAAPGGEILLAVTSSGTSADGQGDYAATPLKPSATWQVSQQTGDFSWSYPIKVPPVPGGLAPSVALGYSSSTVDGHMASTNNQPSWLGEGWESWSGYIERSFMSCADNTDEPAKKTLDKCWFDDNATLMLNGSGGKLVHNEDPANDYWRLKNDDRSKIERLTGATNGDVDGEYWRITKSDGTKYYFGLNRLDGWSAGKPETKSTWTVPVFGRLSGQPCYNATFKDAWCTRAWRWNLDYVVDARGNSMTYYYDTETNNYGRNRNETASQYVRGGTLNRIEYGTRAGQEYAGEPPAKVTFDTAERCAPNTGCSQATATDFPDVPLDQKCDATTCPDKLSPTFWTTKKLTKIVTKARVGSGWQDVDSWSFNHSFPETGDSSSAALWLTGIVHKGHVGGEITLPEVTFDGKRLANRVGSPTAGWGGYLPLYKYRLTKIYSEAGGLVALDYFDGDCDRAALPAADDTNGTRCFPVKWAPPDHSEIDDWFHKYPVREVVETDRVGGAPDQVTSYEYVGTPAWHYTDDPIIPEERRSWSEWRGYQKVRTTKGNTQTERLYYRGMFGDKKAAGGTRTDKVIDSQLGEADDIPAAQGFQREEILKSGPGGATLLTTITTPWTRGPTAKRGPIEAYMTRPASTRTITTLAAGGTRSTKAVNVYNDDGVAIKFDEFGDESTPNDDMCTETTHASNTTAWILDLVVEVKKYGAACGGVYVIPAGIIGYSRNYYDGSTTLGTVPGAGAVTKSEEVAEYSLGVPQFKQVSRAEYDNYGRVTKSWDALDRKSETTYTHTNGLLTTQSVTNPKNFTASTTFNAAWGSPTVKTDANNGTTRLGYDALGRLKTVRMPGRGDNETPNIEYGYTIRKDAVSSVSTTTLNAHDAQSTSYAIYDGLLRPRQTQSPAPYVGRQISDTFYDSRGLVGRTATLYYDDDAGPGPELVTVPAGNQPDLPSQTLTTYDALARPLTQTFRGLGQDKWTTTKVYGGDRVMTTPPAGGTATTVLTDAQGRTTELWQHKAATPTGDKDVTRYEYSRDGKLLKLIDPAGNFWRNTYDLRDRVVTVEDPDRGLTTNTYDDAGQLLTTKDSRNRTVRFEYDELGRKTASYEGTTKLSDWTYDTLRKGDLRKSTRYVGGNAYSSEVTAYDGSGRPTGQKVTIPTAEGSLAGSYETTTGYGHDGSVVSVALPAAGNLAAETLQYTYLTTGEQESLGGTTDYVPEVTYNEYSQVSQIMLNAGVSQGSKWVQLNRGYEADTRRLSDSTVVRHVTGNGVASRSKYFYDPAGNITSVVEAPTNFTTDASGTITSLPNGLPSSVDYQCFKYDHVQQLKEAWAGTSKCAANPSLQVVGGPAGYWQSFTYDAAGNRATDTEHTAAGDTVSTYALPQSGGHLLQSVTSNGPSGQQLQTFEYDQTGNTKKRMANGVTHDLVWDAEGKLTSDTASGQTTSFVYDAEGSRLLRKVPGEVTLYLAGQEIKLTTSTNQKSGTRWYSIAGTTVAARTSSSLTWLAGDHQGTNQVSLNSANLAVTQRRQTPFGESRGTAPASWPDDKGFVGGTNDTTTGLVHLGAREYDAGIGRFISADPIMDLTDPQQINGYAYGNSSPITFSDPTGLKRCGVDGDGCGSVPNRDSYGDRGSTGETAYEYHQRTENEKKNAYAAAGVSEQDIIDAEQVEKQNWLDIALEAGGEILKEVLGINDIQSCFGEGDLGACASMILGAIPWGKILKAPKIVKAIDNAIGAVKSFMKRQDWAKNVLGRGRAALAKITGGGCKNSFTPDTEILLADGTRKALKDVDVGDKVKATDPETGKTEAKTVANVIVGNGKKYMVDVTVEVDGVRSTISATGNHPFWRTDEDRWVRADELKPGALLETAEGRQVDIVEVRPWSAVRQVFNLTVEGIHTYYALTGVTPVLVHNTSCDISKAAAELPTDYPRRTTGILDVGNEQIPLSSGPGGPSEELASLPGRTKQNSDHVETHAAAILRSNPVIRKAVLYVSNSKGQMCPGPNGCAANIEDMLPEGVEMWVYMNGLPFGKFIGNAS
ncbi:RHS repeat-associated core domain-containing protein [Saccharothrix violaceirubra]|uniref:RHS repeat-associated protein n=1 Tax=Saccharothrix violaceirubra TaxID=413306 RepID=A0A7W7WYY0_9PSEU|nr:RHS repeat-associated core domain-containing protein [Saccharothrix violaceirubra]MBB4968900.1 RHS repeat-associated protein [Saccharothrix violaceirubra]